MSASAISLIVFACVFGGALLGLGLRQALPEHHRSPDSKDLVRGGMGLIGTMSALVLGLLVASAKSSYDTQRTEVTQMAAQVTLLDRILSHYGPDALPARTLLREDVLASIERMWPAERRGAPDESLRGEALYDRIQDLAPSSDAQRSLRTDAASMVLQLGQTRWLMVAQQGSSISMPLLSVVVFWLTINFVSFGLFAPRNATVAATLFVCALSVAGAIFLILEMAQPFRGVIRISDAPLRDALSHLGR